MGRAPRAAIIFACRPPSTLSTFSEPDVCNQKTFYIATEICTLRTIPMPVLAEVTISGSGDSPYKK